METFEDRKTGSTPNTGTTRIPERYDKEIIRSEVVSVCFHYLGAGRRQGTRYVWRCPECGKDEKFSAMAPKKLCGCLNADCAMPTTMDAIQMISHFENLPASGIGFVRILDRGYEILGLPDPKNSPPGNPPGSPAGSPRPGPTAAQPATGSREDGQRKGGPSWSRGFGGSGDGRAGERPDPAPSGWTRAPAAEKNAAGERREGRDARYPRDDEPEVTVYDEDGEPSELLPDVPDNIVTVEADEEIEDAEVVEAGDGRVTHGRVRYERRYERLDAYRSYQMGPMGEALRGEAEAWAIYEEPDFTMDGELADAVYQAILEMCQLFDSHAEWLKGRGVSRMTALRGRIGSISAKRARAVKKALLERFSEEELLRVPGFSKKPLRGLSFTLTGEYILIPYHDADHNITTIEGRAIGEPPKGMGKYVSLRGSGNHLYVFPDFMPERLEAFCEGPMGAIVAAQSGIAVGAIQGVRRHRDSKSGGPLPELAGTDFGKRRIPYIPDIDVKPAARADVVAEAPRACRNLIENQNGVPQIALLPDAKDLDEWLLTKKSAERRAAFTSFVAGAVSLERYLEATGQKKEPDTPQDAPQGTPQSMAQGAARPRPGPLGTPAEEMPPPRTKHLANPTAPGPLYEPPEEHGDQRRAPESGHTGPEPAKESPKESPKEPSSKPALAHGAQRAAKIYGAVVRMSSVQQRDIDLMSGFGIPEEITRQAGIGSMSAARARGIAEDLASKIGGENLVDVSGFGYSASGKLTLDFTGDYCLIPYRDASGSITAIQAIPVAEGENGPRVDPERKNVLCGTPGDHLYVPAGQPEKIEVITTSVLEALRLLAAGIRAAAIRKPDAYRPAPGSATLAELEGVDYSGRTVLYAPLLGNPPRENVRRDAPNVMRSLIARHGGTPAMIKLQTEEMTLGEQLASTPAWERREKFDFQLRNAQEVHGLLNKEQRTSQASGNEGGNVGGPDARQHAGRDKGPEDGGTSEMKAVVPPVVVPRAGFESPGPPPMRKPLTPDEALSGVAMIFACIAFALGVLSLWHLPGELYGAMVGVIGEPVAGRQIDPVPFALLLGETAWWAILAAVYESLSGAIFWGCAAACFLAPFAVWRRRIRRRRVREMLRMQSASWWRKLNEALRG